MISTLQLVIARPSGVFDPYVAIAALEEVVDVARSKGDERSTRYSVILQQCRPLISSPSLQPTLIKLVASKEEAKVAKVTGKALKNQPSARPVGLMGRPHWVPYRHQGKPRLQPIKCWLCGRPGHYARSCHSKRQ